MMKQKLSTVPITLLARQFSLFVRQAANFTPSSSPSYSYQRFESAAGTDRRKNASTTTTRPYSILRNFKRVLLSKSNAPLRTYCIAAPTMPTATQACWSCSADLQVISLGGLFCHSCGALRNTNKATDYFEIMGLPKIFTLDTNQLTRRFRQLQGTVHPDKFSMKSSREQELSADWSSLINSAYQTLLVPIRRGEYLLRLHGVEFAEGDAGKNNSTDSKFLMAMMERNEEVDDANDPIELNRLLAVVREDLRVLVGELDASLGEGDVEKAKRNVVSLRYLLSLETSIKSKKSRCGYVD